MFRSTIYHLKSNFFFYFKNLGWESTIKVRQGKARSWKIGCKIFLFPHTLTDQLLRKEASRAKHWDNSLVEVDKSTLENLEKGLCVSYSSPPKYFTSNEFIIIWKKLHNVPYIPLESWFMDFMRTFSHSVCARRELVGGGVGAREWVVYSSCKRNYLFI